MKTMYREFFTRMSDLRLSSNPFAFLICLALIVGCTGETDKSGETSTQNSKQLEEVSLVLNWYPEAEHGGYYAALVHGFYEETGLKVTILPGGPNAPVLQKVDRKSVTFGVTNADRVLLGRAQDANVVAVMSPLQTSPRCIMVHESSGIETLAGLKDLTLAMNSGATWAQFLRKRLPLENVRVVDGASVAKFLEDKNYAQQGYVFSEPFVARSKGGDPRSLLVSELGFNPYTSLLIAHGDTIAEQPDTVRKMVEASIRGWQKYLESPDETNRYINKQNPKMELDILAFGAEALQPLCVDESTPIEQLGKMTEARWQTLANQLVEVEVFKAGGVDPLKAFTLEFLSSTQDDAAPNN